MVATDRIASGADFQDAFGTTDDVRGRLETYVELLVRWNSRINLIGPSTVDAVWERHIADAAQIVAYGRGRCWLDLGTGAGIPGLVVAIMIAGAGGHAHLVESNRKKCAFLREAVRATGAPATIHPRRIESIDSDTIRPEPTTVTARALAPLGKLIDSASPWLERGALGVFLKGQDVDEELTQAAKYWRIVAHKQPSRTDAKGCILLVEEAHRVDT